MHLRLGRDFAEGAIMRASILNRYMDHPNAIYFLLFAHTWLVLAGALLLARSFNKGPYQSANISASWVKVVRVIGMLSVILGLIALYGDLGKLLGV